MQHLKADVSRFPAAYQTRRSDLAKINEQMWIFYEAYHQLLSQGIVQSAHHLFPQQRR